VIVVAHRCVLSRHIGADQSGNAKNKNGEAEKKKVWRLPNVTQGFHSKDRSSVSIDPAAGADNHLPPSPAVSELRQEEALDSGFAACD
jgi:hypothetical protein